MKTEKQRQDIDGRWLKDGVVRTGDGSIETLDGNVLFFSTERFIHDICEGDCCFICGAAPDSKPFNDEHVLPNWILRRYRIHSKTIGLPNESRFRYGGYKIPCCEDCNELMGKELEEPVRQILTSGYDRVVRHLNEEGPRLLWVWLALIFLKTHLKDSELVEDQGDPNGTEVIADRYDWKHLHHVHCVARTVYTKLEIEHDVQGTMHFYPVKEVRRDEAFDYHDLFQSRSMLIQIDDTAIVAVLDDSCGAATKFMSMSEKIAGPLSLLQLREVLAHLSYVNLLLLNRPSFRTVVEEELQIRANVPKVCEIGEVDQNDFGEILWSCTSNLLDQLENPDIEEVKRRVRLGTHTFLWSEDGEFDHDSMDSISKADRS